MKKLITLVTIASSFSAISGTWDNIKPSADFRYRYENYTDEYTTDANEASRSHQRLQARVGLAYELDDVSAINIRLATSGKATSTNDDIGDSNGNAGEVYFDRAYLSHKAGDIKVNMGRMGNQFFKAGNNQLTWDSDINFEGIHAGYSKMGAYLNLASYWIAEDKATNEDVVLNSSQIGYEGSAGMIGYNVGVSGYHYQNAHAQNFAATNEGLNLLETYLELKFDLKMPVMFYVSMVTNTEAEDDNKANIFGIELGKTKAKGSWKVGINSRVIELNSVYNKFMDGDFAGKNTDSSGTVAYAKYMVSDKAYVSLGLFNNTINVDEKLDSSKDAEAYTKLHVDYGVKF